MPTQTTYLAAGILMPAVLLWMAVTLRNEYLLHSAVPWCILFVLLGAFCMASSSIEPVARHNSMSSILRSRIEAIPFRDSQSNGFLFAVLCGDKSLMSTQSINAFRSSGAAHLLALSGMHLGIIYGLLRSILSIFGNYPAIKNIRSIIIIIITAAYTLGCGGNPSLVRAWLFILLYELSSILHRPQSPSRIFCSALTLHLIASPSSALELGFQLSYLAMVGIVFLWPRVRAWYKGEIMRKIWDLTSLSICCQIFTGPLSYFHFGTFPRLFLITNLVAAPLMGIVMVCSLAALVLSASGLSTPWIFATLEYPIRILLDFINTINDISLDLVS